MIASVITHWGTQYRLLKSIHDSKAAISFFCIMDKVEFEYKDILQDKEFWAKLDALILILSKIHDLQKQSEDNKSTLVYVYG